MRSAVSTAVLVLAASALTVLGNGPAGAEERTLIVLLDAVSYSTMVRLTNTDGEGAEALFPGFGPPMPLISTFPSSTSIALAGILGGLGLDRSPGYEPRFFDWEERRRRGGGPLSYFRITFPWRSFFDWNRKGPVRNALHAARPRRSGVREIRHAMAAFKESTAAVFTVYVADTDTAAHLFGPTGVDPILAALDAELKALDSTRVVLLSDHGLAGGERLVNVLPAARQKIVDRGWRPAERLGIPGDVVLTPYGLVSSFEAYADPDLTPALVGALAGVAGVEFCVARTREGWRVAAAESTLDFERREGECGLEWRWRSSGADGGLISVLGDSVRASAGASVGASMPASAGSSVRADAAADWVADEDLLAATARSRYPDPFYRLAGAFSAVENPASVICSVESGYMFGALGTERSARWTKGALRWTHGGLGSEASLGFLMSNRAVDAAPGAHLAVRFDRALDMVLGADTARLASD